MIYKMLNNQYIDLSAIVSMQHKPQWSNYFNVYFGYMKGLTVSLHNDDPSSLYIDQVYKDLLQSWNKYHTKDTT